MKSEIHSSNDGGRQRPVTETVFLAAAAVLIASMALTYWSGLTALNSVHELDRKRDRIEDIENLASRLKDAETGQRGYLLTGDPQYLEPYRRAIGEIDQELLTLDQLAAAGELPRQQVAEIHRLSAEKLAELDETIKLQGVSPEKALEIVRSNKGKQVMDAIRANLRGLRQRELTAFHAANSKIEQTTQQRNWTFILVALGCLGFLGWAYGTISREMRSKEMAQRDVRESEARLRTILESLVEGVIAANLDGKVLHWNQAALNMHGFATLEEAQRSLSEFTKIFEVATLTGAVLPVEQWPLSRILRGEELRDAEYRLRHIQKNWQRIFSYSGGLVRDASGSPLLAVIACNDITGRKQMEAELRQSHNDLEHRVEQRTAELASANKELEAFGYSVSHDLRAPLRHISGYIKMLEKGAGASLDDTGRRHVQTIAQAAERMGHLIDDLLGLSRIGRTSMAEADVNLRRLVDEARQQLAPEMEGRVIEWQIGDLPHIRGDITLLRSAVVNLVSNAIKYSRLKNPARIEIGRQEQDGEIVCYVRDNGAGFDMRFVDKLFGVFQRLHDHGEFEGTGIGLASVRRIIQRHGGRTWAEGCVDHGATFYFSIPKERVT